MNNLSERLRQARRAAGLSLRALGELVSLSHAAIKKYEDGQVYPSSEILLQLAKALNVRADFFFRPVKVELKEVKFRKSRRLPGKTESVIKFNVLQQIERRLELENYYPTPPAHPFVLPAGLPKKISSYEEIESFTEALRTHWKLGMAPIHDLIDALEGLGVRVFITPCDEEHFDGLSTTLEGQPLIVVSSKRPGDRQRFNLLHELAHTLLQGRLSPELDEEKGCNRFAGAFLFPRDAVFQNVGRQRHRIELQELLFLKGQFGLSMGAICHRLHELSIIPEGYFRKVKQQFRNQGWDLKEPGPGIAPEQALCFEQLLFHALAEEYISESKAAELLTCSLSQLKAYRAAKNPHVITHR